MIPLSCVNCCHNPLQLASIGTAFGYCTRHRVVLNAPARTTCGQLLRKDLLADAADAQQAAHARRYRSSLVVLVVEPREPAARLGLTERANGQLPGDVVFDEVKQYGQLDSKIATMASLRHLPGARAEIARLSLSRAYFHNCFKQSGTWTPGLHLFFWTLRHLADEPVFEASELRGPFDSLRAAAAVARWSVLAFRLAFIGDVGSAALGKDDRIAKLAELPEKSAAAAGSDPDKLLGWLRRKQRAWSSALSLDRYQQLSESLSRPRREDSTDP